VPVVVLLHGFPFDARLWDPQFDALAGRFRLLAPDLRGFGGSELPPRPYTLANLADDVAELLDALAIERVVIGGLSMGGYIAFEFFRRHRARIAALLLADTRPEPDGEEARANRRQMAGRARERGTAAIVEELIPKLLAPATRAGRPAIERSLRAMMESAAPAAIAAALAAMAERADSAPLLPAIDVPALVIGGEHDVMTPPDAIRGWAARLPDARCHIIPAAGHVPNLERPDEFNALLERFLLEPRADTGARRAEKLAR
jgi:pimeloyl-ACP methyl ester carboxylesterase